MAAHAEPISGERRESQLSASITKKTLLLFIVGDILGGGIYARAGEVEGEIGGAIWAGFALAAVSLVGYLVKARREVVEA